MPIVDGAYVAPNWVNDDYPAIDAEELNAISQTAENILLPKLTITTADSYDSVKATNGEDTIALTQTSSGWVGYFTGYGTWTVTATGSGGTGKAVVEVDAVTEYTVALVPEVLNNASWSAISAIAQSGTAASYWSVGDTKTVALSGTVGTLSLNTTLYVYIIGINHGGVNGITFQGFKTAQTDGISVALVDSHYGSNSSDGSKWFNMNHWGAYNYGGWAACDMRYDILGSTNVAPSPYGSVKTTDATGSNPTSTCATNPVANTLMSCLPSDLRAVMRPMTVYTNNVGNSTVESAVTATEDYLILLAEFEIFGGIVYANQYEPIYQTRYAYYANGNGASKYKHNATGTSATWWGRTPASSGYSSFCGVVSGGARGSNRSFFSEGLAPAFLV